MFIKSGFKNYWKSCQTYRKKCPRTKIIKKGKLRWNLIILRYMKIWITKCTASFQKFPAGFRLRTFNVFFNFRDRKKREKNVNKLNLELRYDLIISYILSCILFSTSYIVLYLKNLLKYNLNKMSVKTILKINFSFTIVKYTSKKYIYIKKNFKNL